jgi:hypothetical protein
MEQVLVKVPQLHNNLTILRPADVLARNGGRVRVKVRGESLPREVEAANVMPVSSVFTGRPRINFGKPVAHPMRQFPDRGAIGFQER